MELASGAKSELNSVPDDAVESLEEIVSFTMFTASASSSETSASASASTPAAAATKHSKHDHMPHITHPARRVASEPPLRTPPQTTRLPTIYAWRLMPPILPFSLVSV